MKNLLLMTIIVATFFLGCKTNNQTGQTISAPVIAGAKPASSTQIDVFWSQPNGEKVSSYNVKANGKEVLTGHTYISAPIKDLTPDTVYKFEVQSVDASGNKSAWSETVSATTLK